MNMNTVTKNKIIDVSIDLFSKNGYADASIRDIAKQSGIKPSSIYYHFNSKETILDYILEMYVNIEKTGPHRGKWNKTRELLGQEGVTITAKEIVDVLFFTFPPENAEQYRKILKIIYSEQIHNDKVREYFRNTYLNDSYAYIKSVLDFLIEAKKIPECDTQRISGTMYSIALAFTSLSCIDISVVDESAPDTNMFSLLEYTLSLVVEGVK